MADSPFSKSLTHEDEAAADVLQGIRRIHQNKTLSELCGVSSPSSPQILLRSPMNKENRSLRRIAMEGHDAGNARKEAEAALSASTFSPSQLFSKSLLNASKEAVAVPAPVRNSQDAVCAFVVFVFFFSFFFLLLFFVFIFFVFSLPLSLSPYP